MTVVAKLPSEEMFTGGLSKDLLEAKARMDEFAGEREKRERSKTIGDAAFEKACLQAKRFMSSGDWSEATPRHFVALYAMLHEEVYGVKPTELGPPQRLQAAGFAARLLAKQFDGDAGALAAFVRWTWVRERTREAKRRAEGAEGGRIGWKLQFHLSFVTDYRLAQSRARGRR